MAEEVPAMRMFTSAADGTIGEILKSHPEGEEARQEVWPGRGRSGPRYLPPCVLFTHPRGVLAFLRRTGRLKA